MPKFNSLRIAIDLATSKRDQALAALRQQRFSHAHALNQMNQLQQYADETQARWTRTAHAGTSPELLHHHYQFMSRLQQAVLLQQAAINTLESKVKVSEQQLLNAEVHIASLKLVLAKRQSERVKIEQRREQKQMDEFAAMQTQRQRRQQLESHDGY